MGVKKEVAKSFEALVQCHNQENFSLNWKSS